MDIYIRVIASLWLWLVVVPVSAWGEEEVFVPEIQIFPSLGSPSHLVIRGRVFQDGPDRNKQQSAFSQNLRRLFGNQEWKNAPLRVTVAGMVRQAQADDEGFFAVDLEIKEPLAPQYHPVEVEVLGVGGVKANGKVLIVAPGQTVVVSDFDDTVAITHVTSMRRMLRTAFFSTEKTQEAVPGMAQLYQCLQETGSTPHAAKGSPKGAAVFFLSGSPRQFFGRIREFLHMKRFPLDGISLRPITSIVHNTGKFKQEQLERFLKEFPENRFVLVGDSGEHDPEVYAKAALLAKGRVIRTYIRIVTSEPLESPRWQKQFAFTSVYQVAKDAVSQGLVSEKCLEQVLVAEKANGGGLQVGD